MPISLMKEKNPSITNQQIRFKNNRIIYHDQVGFLPGIQGWFNISKLLNVIHYINKLKTKSHSSHQKKEKLLTKQHPFMIKTLHNVCIKGTYISIIKAMYASSVQSLSHVQVFVIPWTPAHQASLSITNSWRLADS